MKKVIILAIAAVLAFNGCKSASKIQVIDNGVNNTNAVMQTGFNGENYIWEAFLFPTNRVK